jgi:hypothetical protein
MGRTNRAATFVWEGHAVETFALGFRGGTVWYTGQEEARCYEPTTTEEI